MIAKKLLSILMMFVCIVFSATLSAQSADYNAEQEAEERIKRQLELANELREKRLRKQREKEEQLRDEEQLEKRCARLKDELRRLGERKRWYRLNNTGERIYLTEAEVKRNKQTTQQEYDQKCEEVQ